MEPPLPRAGAAAILSSNPTFTARLHCKDLRRLLCGGEGLQRGRRISASLVQFCIIFNFFPIETECRRDAELRK